MKHSACSNHRRPAAHQWAGSGMIPSNLSDLHRPGEGSHIPFRRLTSISPPLPLLVIRKSLAASMQPAAALQIQTGMLALTNKLLHLPITQPRRSTLKALSLMERPVLGVCFKQDTFQQHCSFPKHFIFKSTHRLWMLRFLLVPRQLMGSGKDFLSRKAAAPARTTAAQQSVNWAPPAAQALTNSGLARA